MTQPGTDGRGRRDLVPMGQADERGRTLPVSGTGYARIKALAKRRHVAVPALLVLAPKNDPFYAGSPAQERHAQWFAAVWERFGYTGGMHLRRMHYQLVSQHDPRKDDGLPYENTEGCWDYLNA